MDVWKLTEKLKKVDTNIEDLLSRIAHIETYLAKLTEVKDEAVQSKKSTSSSVRTRRRTAKKS